MQPNKERRIHITQNIYYLPKQLLGKGTYAHVYKGVDTRDKGKFVAIKILTLNNAQSQIFFNRELQSLEEIKHNNIVKFYGCYNVPQHPKQKSIVMQYCEGGTLKQYIIKNPKGLPQSICLEYFKTIVNTMASINSDLFIHRDLKPQNLLLTLDQQLKIADFGISRKIEGDDPSQIANLTNRMGSDAYMAPQVSIRQLGGYSSKCDVWSAGLILLEMLTGSLPWKNFMQLSDFVKAIQNGKIDRMLGALKQHHNFFKQILRLTLVYDQKKRCSFKQLQKFVNESYQNVHKQLTFSGDSENNDIGKQGLLISDKQLNNFTRKPIKYETEMDNLDFLPPPNLIQQVSRMQYDLNHKQRSETQKQNIFKYVQFLHKRSELFLIFGRKILESRPTPLNKFESYIVSGMVVGVFVQTLTQLVQLLQSDVVNLLGQQIVTKNFHKSCRQDYINTRNGYIKNIKEKRQLYRDCIRSLSNKFSSKQAENYEKGVLFEFRHVKKQVINAASEGRFSQPRSWFQTWFKKFFMDYQCPQLNNIQNQSEQFIRIYWGCLHLAEVEDNFPLISFGDINMLDKFHDKFKNTPIDQIKEQLILKRSKIIQ